MPGRVGPSVNLVVRPVMCISSGMDFMLRASVGVYMMMCVDAMCDRICRYVYVYNSMLRGYV